VKLDSLSLAIQECPRCFLPEESLQMLGFFRRGYDLRRGMAAKPYAWSDDEKGAFANFVRSHYKVRTRSINHLAVISSFSPSEFHAFHEYYSLLQEFSNKERATDGPSGARGVEEYGLAEIIRSIRQDPQKYLPFASFLGLCAFLSGENNAYQDLQLPADTDRKIFEDFKEWVIAKKNRALPRPWRIFSVL
jgi:hypothetical protein